MMKSSIYEDITRVIQILSDLCPILIIQQHNTDTIDTSGATEWFTTNIYNNIPIHRFLYYTTNIGKIAILRQLKPTIHIEYDEYIVKQLSTHIRILQLLSSNGTGNEDDPKPENLVPIKETEIPWMITNKISNILK